MCYGQHFRPSSLDFASRFLMAQRLVWGQFNIVILIQCRLLLPKNKFLILSSGQVVPIYTMNNVVLLWKPGLQGVPVQEYAVGSSVRRWLGPPCAAHRRFQPAPPQDTSEPFSDAGVSTIDVLFSLYGRAFHCRTLCHYPSWYRDPKLKAAVFCSVPLLVKAAAWDWVEGDRFSSLQTSPFLLLELWCCVKSISPPLGHRNREGPHINIVNTLIMLAFNTQYAHF